MVKIIIHMKGDLAPGLIGIIKRLLIGPACYLEILESSKDPYIGLMYVRTDIVKWKVVSDIPIELPEVDNTWIAACAVPDKTCDAPVTDKTIYTAWKLNRTVSTAKTLIAA